MPNQRRTDGPSTLADEILGKDIAASADVPDSLLADMFEEVARDTVDRPATWRDHLRDLSSTARIGLATVFSLGCGATFIAMMGLRPDLDWGSAMWLMGLHLVVLLVSVAGLSLALRPAHRRPLGTLAWVGALSLLTLPFAVSLVPGMWPGSTNPAPMMAHLMCGSGGLLIALPATVFVLLLDRSPRIPAWRVLVTSGAAGLAAFSWGAWNCHNVSPGHLLLGHAGAGLVVGLLTVGVLAVVSRLGGPRP